MAEGVGLNRGGAVRAALKVRKDDLYETPPEATQALLRVEALPHRIWEPAAGRRAIADVLEEAGHDVLCTDLVRRKADRVHEGIDFLMEPVACDGIECIVTNPPFKNADEFVRHGLRLCPKVIMLLRWAYAEGAGRSDIMDRHCSRIWLGKERLSAMHRDQWQGAKLTNSAMPFAWFVFEREPINPGIIELRRMSWRR